MNCRNFSRITFLLLILISGCSKVEYDPKSLGFSSKEEMDAAFAMGYHTKQKFDEKVPKAPPPAADAKTTGGEQPAQAAASDDAQVQSQAQAPIVPQNPPPPEKQAVAPPPAPITDCDRLAANDADSQKVSAGISYAKINASAAMLACKESVAQHPNSGRLWFQYGRALEKGGQLPEAVSAYQEGIKQNHPGAINNLGELYLQGKGVEKDINRAISLFRQSADLGYSEAPQNLAAAMNKK
jgi:TPR repeat protein